MKGIFNDADLKRLTPEQLEKVYPYFTLPNGVTITHPGCTPVLNEDILESPEVKEAIKAKLLRIGDCPEPSDSSHT